MTTKSSESATVLIVDDEPRMLAMLELATEAAGYQPIGARSADEAWAVLVATEVDLVVLDVMLPGTSGLELCRRIREHADLPIILLTALGATGDRVAGLEAGADDYLTKPFSPRELILRIGNLLRRAAGHDRGTLASTRRTIGELVLDASLMQARRGHRDLHLTPGEFRLLWLLAESPGRTVSTEELLDVLRLPGELWGGRAALRTAVYRLRHKVEEASSGVRIVTEHGRGYRLVS